MGFGLGSGKGKGRVRVTLTLTLTWMALPPTPAKASMTRSQQQRAARWVASTSGVTENQPSRSIRTPSSYLVRVSVRVKVGVRLSW